MFAPPAASAELFGLAGVAIYLISYGLLQSGRLRQEGVAYSVLNLLAASLVLISLTSEFNLASALIQTSWIMISLAGLCRVALLRRSQKRKTAQLAATEDRTSARMRLSIMNHADLDVQACSSQVVEFIDLGDPFLQNQPARETGQGRHKVTTDRLSARAAPRGTWIKLNKVVANLPPFWTAFALTLTETVGAGTLALPIAIATIGPMAGLFVLVFLGLLNMMTVSYLAEASARNATVRYGHAYVGRLVSDFLGPSAAIIMRLFLFAFCCIILVSYYTGFASTLSAATGLPAPFWVAVICGIGMLLIAGKSLVGTLASALLVGTINVLVIIALSVLALKHANLDNLLSSGISSASDSLFSASRLQLVFGVVLVSYFGHLSVSNCAQAVLRRDPDGRSLKRGTAAAMLVAIAIYGFWTVSIGSAISSERLHAESGTALVPLAEQLGSGVYVLGIVFAVLGLGMSSIHYGLGIVNTTREVIAELITRKTCSPQTSRTALWIAFLPIVAVFAYVQWTYISGTESFSAPLELLGALVAPVLAGIFPVLLLHASRAQGLCVGGARLSRLTTHPLVLGFIIIVSFAAILTQALIVWNQPLPRATALFVALLMAWMIGHLHRRKTFSPALCIDLRYFSERQCAKVTIAYDGCSLTPRIKLLYLDGTQKFLSADAVIDNFPGIDALQFSLPADTDRRLQVHAFRVFDGVEAVPMAGILRLRHGDRGLQDMALDVSTGVTRISLPTRARQSTAVTIRAILSRTSRQHELVYGT